MATIKRLRIAALLIVLSILGFLGGLSILQDKELAAIALSQDNRAYEEQPTVPGKGVNYTSRTCKHKRGFPTSSINIAVMKRIKQIKNCPCNVNFVNETNPLCATADTLEGVRHRKNLSYIPESRSPCVFVDRRGDNYELADVNTQQNSQWRFLDQANSSRQLYCLPSLYFPGVPKCGTTTLYYYLAKHQNIRSVNAGGGWSFWNGGGFKEKALFLDDNHFSRYNLFAFMRGSKSIADDISSKIKSKLTSGSEGNQVLDNTLMLDISQGTYRQSALEKLAKFVPNRKCIIIMRDPVERVFSFFRFSPQIDSRKKISWFRDQTARGFHNYVIHNLDTRGTRAFPDETYAIMTRHIFGIMPKEDVVFIQFEEFVKSTFGVIEKQILPVLGLQPYKENIKKQMGNHRQKNASMHQFKMLNETRILLQNYFRNHNHELSLLLNDPKWTWGY